MLNVDNNLHQGTMAQMYQFIEIITKTNMQWRVKILQWSIIKIIKKKRRKKTCSSLRQVHHHRSRGKQLLLLFLQQKKLWKKAKNSESEIIVNSRKIVLQRCVGCIYKRNFDYLLAELRLLIQYFLFLLFPFNCAFTSLLLWKIPSEIL